jgi:hypothetical protein
MPDLFFRRHQSFAFFGRFSGYDTAGQQGREVGTDAEHIVKTEFTLKLVPFVRHTEVSSGPGVRHVGFIDRRIEWRPETTARRNVNNSRKCPIFLQRSAVMGRSKAEYRRLSHRWDRG